MKLKVQSNYKKDIFTITSDGINEICSLSEKRSQSMKRYKLILWGTGKRSDFCFRKGYFKEHELVCVIDSYKKIDTYHSLNVYKPNVLSQIIDQADYLVILNQYYDEIIQQCWNLHIPFEKIIITDNIQGVFYSTCFNKLKNVSEELYQSMCVEELRLMDTNLSDRIDDERKLGRGKYDSKSSVIDYMVDYYRFRTFELVAREIKAKKIKGAIAELGVFRGKFASLINDTFSDRKLYLFDTFESFDLNEYENEKILGRCGDDDGFLLAHTNTSVEIMLANVPYPEQCIVCKGLFPNTVTKEIEQEKFVFVSLDVDLEESTYQGLKFFYPRLETGGYIFVHDYTTHWLQGVKIAIERYEKDANVKLHKVPLADRGGTLVITK